MGIPNYGDTQSREIQLPAQQRLIFAITAAHSHHGAIPEIKITMQGKTDLATAEVKAALSSPNDLRDVAIMFNNMANRLDQINEEAQDDYYEDEG